MLLAAYASWRGAMNAQINNSWRGGGNIKGTPCPRAECRTFFPKQQSINERPNTTKFDHGRGEMETLVAFFRNIALSSSQLCIIIGIL